MNSREAVVRCRNLLTEKSESRVDLTFPHIFALLPTALEQWTRACLTDREKRELFKTRFNADLVDGRLDLTSFIDGTDARINLKELRETPIYSGETIYTTYRTFIVDKGVTDTDVVASVANSVTATDIGNRIIVTGSDGTILGTTSIATYVDTTNFTLTDGISDAYTGATAVLYATETCEKQNSYPYTWLSSLQQLSNARPVGSDAPACFLEGINLRTRTTGGRLDGTDTLIFTVTNYPSKVEDITKELEHDFILFLAALAVKEVGTSAAHV